MSGDYTMGDLYRAWKADRKERRATTGVPCPGCPKVQPKRIPSVLMPQQRCRVCGYHDQRACEAKVGERG